MQIYRLFILRCLFPVFLLVAPSARTEDLALIDDGKWAWPIIGVLDGDTIRLLIPGLPPPVQYFSIRIRGVDAPELPPKARCPEEAKRALRAKQFTDFFFERREG